MTLIVGTVVHYVGHDVTDCRAAIVTHVNDSGIEQRRPFAGLAVLNPDGIVFTQWVMPHVPSGDEAGTWHHLTECPASVVCVAVQQNGHCPYCAAGHPPGQPVASPTMPPSPIPEGQCTGPHEHAAGTVTFCRESCSRCTGAAARPCFHPRA